MVYASIGHGVAFSSGWPVTAKPNRFERVLEVPPAVLTALWGCFSRVAAEAVLGLTLSKRRRYHGAFLGYRFSGGGNPRVVPWEESEEMFVMRTYQWPVLGVAVLLVATGCTGKYKKQVSDQEAQIAQLQQKVGELEGRLSDEQKRTEDLSKELAEALSDYRAKEQVWLEQKEGRAIVTVSDAVLFESGSADLTGTGTDIVDKIVGVIQKYPDRSIMIEGHTDNVPIGPSIKERYQSNWELSSGRACSVLRYIYWQHKMDPQRLSAVGYGEYRPIAANDTDESRGKNRRVVIVIGPSDND